MIGRVAADYFNDLVDRVGRGWNGFWYRAGDPLRLGVIRICTGLVALYLHLTYMPDVAHFFKRSGLLPSSLSRLFLDPESSIDTGRLSYLSYLDSPVELYVAHAIGAAVLLLFTVGLFSRVTSVLALIVTLSYVYRSPFTTSQVEFLLVMLQFYLCIGPCGARLSVDSWLARSRSPGEAVTPNVLDGKLSVSANISWRLIQVHTCLIYLMMGLAKVAGPGILTNVDEWYDPWGAGEAVWWMIARPESRMVDLTWLRSVPYVVQAWTHAIVLFEVSFPLFIWNRLARPLWLGWSVLMWSSFALISGVPVFSVLMLIANLSFLDDKLLRSLLTRNDQVVTDASFEAASQSS